MGDEGIIKVGKTVQALGGQHAFFVQKYRAGTVDYSDSQGSKESHFLNLGGWCSGICMFYALQPEEFIWPKQSKDAECPSFWYQRPLTREVNLQLQNFKKLQSLYGTEWRNLNFNRCISVITKGNCRINYRATLS